MSARTLDLAALERVKQEREEREREEHEHELAAAAEQQRKDKEARQRKKRAAAKRAAKRAAEQAEASARDESARPCYCLRICLSDFCTPVRRDKRRVPLPFLAPKYMFNVGVVKSPVEGDGELLQGEGARRSAANVRLGRPCHCTCEECCMWASPFVLMCGCIIHHVDVVRYAPFTRCWGGREMLAQQKDKEPPVDVDLAEHMLRSPCVEYRYVDVEEDAYGEHTLKVVSHGMCCSETVNVEGPTSFFVQEHRPVIHRRIRVRVFEEQTAGGRPIFRTQERDDEYLLHRLVARVGPMTLALMPWVRFADTVQERCHSDALYEAADVLTGAVGSPPEQRMVAPASAAAYEPPKVVEETGTNDTTPLRTNARYGED